MLVQGGSLELRHQIREQVWEPSSVPPSLSQDSGMAGQAALCHLQTMRASWSLSEDGGSDLESAILLESSWWITV